MGTGPKFQPVADPGPKWANRDMGEKDIIMVWSSQIANSGLWILAACLLCPDRFPLHGGAFLGFGIRLASSLHLSSPWEVGLRLEALLLTLVI